MNLLIIIIGFAFLITGAESLVRGSSRLAALAGVSPLIIGLTVVAFGTSSPELAVSVKAGFSGQPDLALGNVVGSNIFNTLFILGISALIVPLTVARQLIRLDVPVMIGVSVLLWTLAANGVVGRREGLLLVGLGVAYTVFLIFKARRESNHYENARCKEPSRNTGVKGVLLSVLLVVAGLAALFLGARWLVSGASGLARQIRVSELVIGLTVVAAGTSLPEVATSVVAALRGERDIAVGNVIGSNIFNILFVLGTTGALSGGVRVGKASLGLDLPVTTSAAVLCLPIFFTEGRISRREGALFLGYYLTYTGYLILTAGKDHQAVLSGGLVLGFIASFTVIVTLFSLIRDLKKRRTR